MGPVQCNPASPASAGYTLNRLQPTPQNLPVFVQSAAAAIDAKANVCSVQFSPTDANLMAFGAANYRTYLYDLRTIKVLSCVQSSRICVCPTIRPSVLILPWPSPLEKVSPKSAFSMASSTVNESLVLLAFGGRWQ